MFDSATLDKRRERFIALLNGDLPLVVVGAGQPISKPGGLDQTYPFQPHPEYYWLTGSRRWGGAVAFDADDGWTHFVRPVNAAERLWEADIEAPPGRDVKQLEDWLNARADRPIAVLGAPIAGVQGDDPDTVLIRGGSCVISPLGQVLAGPLWEKEGILTADLDFDDIARGKYDFDVAGHYSRPDVFRLSVNERPARPVETVDGFDKPSPG